MNDIEHARMLLAAAEKDLRALNAMEDAQTFADEIFGFHAQQAIEKALKAWLAFLHQEYPLTHNLATLLARLEQQGCEVERLQDLVFYTPFAVVFRYGAAGIPLPALDRPAVCSQVQGCFDHVKTVIESSGAAG
jgi:HEPN domain-containing protein